MTSKIIVSVILAFAVGGVAVVSLSDTGDSSAQDSAASERFLAEITALRSEFSEGLAGIDERLSSLESLSRDQGDMLARVERARAASAPVAIAAKSGESGEAGEGVSIDDLQGLVAAVLQQEREVQSAERERQREEFLERAEERRRRIEAMSEGPYDRYNLKVNSLGNILGLNDNQKQAYFELASAYRGKLDEGMKELRAKAEAERENREQERGEDGRRDRRRGGFGREGFSQYRELRSNLDKEFQAGVGQLFNAQQLETFNELSSDARSFSDRDEVRAPGEESRRRGGFDFGGGRGRGSSGRRGR